MRESVFENVFLLTTLSVFMLQLGACNDEIEQINIIRREIVENGFTPNGFTPNGFTPNGFTPNGFSLNDRPTSGMSLDNLSLNGSRISGLALRGSSFSGSTASGRAISGLDFIGALATVNAQSNGGGPASSYTLRFDKIYVDPQTPQGDIFLYDVSYQRSGDPTWTSLCADRHGGAVSGVPILNYWNMQTGDRIDDPSFITFACISGALGKCVRLGYRPWAQVNSCATGSCTTISMANHHQACTRLIRADYCGNGNPYTLEGTLIEVYDGLSPQIQKQTMNWNMEAKWSPKGAECIGDMRHGELIENGKSPDCDGDGMPDRFVRCGDSSYLRGSALMGSTFDGDQ